VTQIPDNGLITGIMALKNASLEDIKAKYAEVFGQGSPCSNNKIFLWRKIAYRYAGKALRRPAGGHTGPYCRAN
jgi:nitrate reductase assembly molybdenum cofactor insertion protein NarJ